MTPKFTRDATADPPDLVAAALPMRERRRPIECTDADRCWVKIGRRSASRPNPGSNVAPRCNACGGIIKAVIIALGALVSPGSWAHDAGVPFYDWLVSRERPDHPGNPCCGAGPNTDQYYAASYEQNPDGSYVVWVEPHPGQMPFGKPALVPEFRVIHEDINPTGRGVIWISVDWPTPQGPPVPGVIFCFEPAVGL